MSARFCPHCGGVLWGDTMLVGVYPYRCTRSYNLPFDNVQQLTPPTQSATFEATYISSSRGVLMVSAEDWEKIGDLVSEHVATVSVAVTWLDAR